MPNVINDMTPYRLDEFKKEEKRRSLGRGSAKGTPKEYTGSRAQAYGVDDNSAHRIVARLNMSNTQPHSSPNPREPNSKVGK